MLVFVYGSLKRGFWNHRLLLGAVFEGADCITGALHDLGAVPAVALDDVRPTTVRGEVYTVDATTLERLDRLEGTPRLYQRTRVRMSTGREAWVYVMGAERLKCRPRIESGTWKGDRT